MMERLTKHKFGNVVSENQEKTGIHCSNFCNNCSRGTGDCKHLKAIVEKLAAYEDAEEQGLLLKLPCKVGDTVYAIGFNNKPVVYESVVLNILIAEKEIIFNVKVDEFGINSQLKQSMFGKTVFLTKVEAEQKLKEMESGEDNEG